MDSGHSNETECPNNTLLTYTLSADGQDEGERGVRKSLSLSGSQSLS